MTTPPLILILDDNQIQRLRMDDEGMRIVRNPDIEIIRYPLDESSELNQELLARGVVQRESLLVQSPYDQYGYRSIRLITQVSEEFAEEKYHATAVVCGYLGATSFKIEAIYEELEEYDTEAGTTGAIPKMVSGKSQIKRNKREDLKERWKMADGYTDLPHDIERAEAYIKQNRMWGDPNLRSLLELRRENRLRTRNLSIDLSRESAGRLDMAAALEVPAYFSGLQSSLERIRTKKVRFSLNFKVSFE